MSRLNEIFQTCRNIVFDVNYTSAKKWKEQDSKRVLVGMIPNFFPREIIHAANGLAIGIVGDEYKILQNTKPSQDANQSCSLFSGIIDLVNKDKLDGFDGFLLPSRCDTLEAIGEINKISDKCKFVKFINFPQYFHTVIGDILNQHFVQGILDEIFKINGVKVNTESLNYSIGLYKTNLKLTEKIYSLSMKFPEKLTQDELYITVFSGLVMPIEEHNAILNSVIDILMEGMIERDDNAFKVYLGAYC